MNNEMPTTLGSGLAAAPIKNRKSVRIEEVTNGFVVTLMNVRDYNDRQHIASDQSQVMEIIQNYLNSEE